MSENEKAPANLSTVYQEVCASYHGIADFRAKLLGFLPLASGAGIFLLLGQLPDPECSPTILLAVGLFGFLVTLGLFTYELRGIQRCNALIAVGKKLEQELGFQGQFRLRPGAINGIIGTTLAARIIYPAVLAAWTFVALYGIIISNWGGMIIAAVVFVAGVDGSFRLKLKPTWDELQKRAQVE
jgi:divalent metal cation (Fe/Co/Zn/Cd) transporter